MNPNEQPDIPDSTRPETPSIPRPAEAETSGMPQSEASDTVRTSQPEVPGMPEPEPSDTSCTSESEQPGMHLSGQPDELYMSRPERSCMPLPEKLAHAVSWFLHPFVLPVYVLAVLLTATAFACYPAGVKWYLVWVVMLYTILLPVLSLGLLRSLGRITDWRIDERHERIWPLAVGVVCYILCAVTIGRIPSASFLSKFMIAAACCEAMCLAVTFYWKISLHLTAVGAVTALFVILNVLGVGNMMWPLIVTILCGGVLASARLYLGSHNGWQVLAGFCGGLLVAAFAMLFL